MKTITIDFETFWTSDFSLSKMSFIEYIRSPAFEVISCSIKEGDSDTYVVFGHDPVGDALRSLDWANSACIAHNGNEFDFPLLVWTYGVHPKLFIDTLCLAKARHQSSAGGSLKALSEHYNLPKKDNTVLHNTKGKRLADFTQAEIDAMREYNKTDTDNTYELFTILRAPDIPTDEEDIRSIGAIARAQQDELRLMDMSARMICYPRFDCDIALLNRTLAEAEAEKDKLLLSVADILGVLEVEEVRAELGSSKKFAAVLQSLNVPVPMKISKTTGKPTYALAKTDEEFTALLNHDDERVQLLAAARLGTKSALLETRLAKMSTCAMLMNGKMPVPLGYHSATTGRWGGRVWNPQNLPRIPRNKDGSIVPKLTNALRMSLRAPDGFKVVVSDLSGIELRVNHYLWGVDSTQKLYKADPEADLYKEFASALFGVERYSVTKDQRQLAKVAQLGLGFGAGANTFRKVAKLMGGIDLDEDEAKRVTDAWRIAYNEIVAGWRQCQAAIIQMYRGTEWSPDPRGLVITAKDKLRLPSGRWLYYPNVRQRINEDSKVDFIYGAGRNESKVYSGLLDENIVQAIARDVIARQALQIWRETGRYPSLTVHDELVYIVPDAEAEQHLATINRVMRTPPAWLPGIVLWSEGDIAQSYGEAK